MKNNEVSKEEFEKAAEGKTLTYQHLYGEVVCVEPLTGENPSERWMNELTQRCLIRTAEGKLHLARLNRVNPPEASKKKF